MLKVGDRVRIKYAKAGSYYNDVRANDIMEKYVGKEATIVNESEAGKLFLDIDERWTWDESMLELVCISTEDRVLLEYAIEKLGEKLGITKEKLIEEIKEKREKEQKQKLFDEVEEAYSNYCEHNICNEDCEYLGYGDCKIMFTIEYIKNKYKKEKE